MNILESNIDETVTKLIATYRLGDRRATDADAATVERWANKALSDAALIEMTIQGTVRIVLEHGIPHFTVPPRAQDPRLVDVQEH